MTSRLLHSVCIAAALLLTAACFRTTEAPILVRRTGGVAGKGGSRGPAAGSIVDDPAAMTGASGKASGGGDTPQPLSPAPGRSGTAPTDAPLAPGESATGRGVCARNGYCAAIVSPLTHGADILFVIDNSGSMRGTQAALADELPRMIEYLTSGHRDSYAILRPPVRDLHVGIVSTDMGLIGVPNSYPGCNTDREVNGGDDGLLQHRGDRSPNCNRDFPSFLEYEAGTSDSASALLGRDLACMTRIGTAGCSFEQPLESGLKALWPRNYVDGNGTKYPLEKNPVLFLSSTDEGKYGHGDVDVSMGGNAPFFRNDPQHGLPILQVVVVTDEDDCSSRNTDHFVETDDPNGPLSRQGLNLRCYYNKQNLFDTVRYTEGFKALRPGREDTVYFAAIVGVPEDLSDTIAKDFDYSNTALRESYYERMLNDVQMQERPVNEDTPAIANLTPSCMRFADGAQTLPAYPPRRIVEVARGMGDHGLVTSICQPDLHGATNEILKLAFQKPKTFCTPGVLTRDPQGRVACDVIAELPPAGGPPDLPTRCADRTYLSSVSAPRDNSNPDGGVNCKVNQLAVFGPNLIEDGEGFYYTDWDASDPDTCPGQVNNGVDRRIYFKGADLLGLPLYLDCDPTAGSPEVPAP